MSHKERISFNEIYTSYFTKSFLYVKSYIHDDMAAEDITIESLIKLWEQLKKSNIHPMDSYLFVMLKNRSLDYLKHQALKHQVHETILKKLNRELEIRLTSLESSDPNEIFSNEVQKILNDTLDLLPERTKEIFIMSRFGNKSHKEIAKMYNISVKGVDYHIMQSVSKLRMALKDYLPLVGFLSFLRL